MKLDFKNIWFLPVCVAVLTSTAVLSQEKPTGHAEILKNVQAYWDLWAKRDLEGFLEYLHDAYSGWNYEAPMHRSKESTRRWINHTFQTRKVIVYDINAVDIKIHGSVAIVHYYYSILEKDPEGKERKITGRKSDILMKHDDKWVLIAEHGGHTFEN